MRKSARIASTAGRALQATSPAPNPTFSSFDKLPSELLCLVFSFCRPQMGDTTSPNDIQAIELVCSRWRQVVLTTPRLSATIRCHIPGLWQSWAHPRVLAALERHLERSGSTPLDVSIIVQRSASGIHATRPLKMLLDHIQRWRQFRFEGDERSLIRIFRGIRKGNTAEYLHLGREADGPHAFRVVRNLELEEKIPTWITFNELRDLHLSFGSWWGLSFPTFICPKLQSVHINMDISMRWWNSLVHAAPHLTFAILNRIIWIENTETANHPERCASIQELQVVGSVHAPTTPEHAALIRRCKNVHRLVYTDRELPVFTSQMSSITTLELGMNIAMWDIHRSSLGKTTLKDMFRALPSLRWFSVLRVEGHGQCREDPLKANLILEVLVEKSHRYRGYICPYLELLHLDWVSVPFDVLMKFALKRLSLVDLEDDRFAGPSVCELELGEVVEPDGFYIPSGRYGSWESFMEAWRRREGEDSG